MPKPHRGRSPQPENSAANPRADFGSPPAAHSASALSSGSTRRPTYPEAVARYESGMRALQEHRFREAADAFKAVLLQYPEEKELNERIRLYLALCERHLSSTPEP